MGAFAVFPLPKETVRNREQKTRNYCVTFELTGFRLTLARSLNHPKKIKKHKEKSGEIMKTKVFVFYAISVLSLSLFLIAPSSDGSSETAMPAFALSQTLIESADHLLAVTY